MKQPSTSQQMNVTIHSASAFLITITAFTTTLLPVEARAVLIASYQFEESLGGFPAEGDNSILDSSGNELHGTPFGGPIYRPFGVSLGLEFDGTNDQIFIADDPLFEITQSLTIAARIHLNSYTGSTEIVFRGDDRGARDPYQLLVTSSGQLELAITNANNVKANLFSPDPVPLGQSVFVAGTLDDATGVMQLWINGQVVKTKSTEIRPFGELDPLKNPGIGIGSRTDPAQLLDGMIDDVLIFNEAINILELQSSADFDGDGDVDANDFLWWQIGFGDFPNGGATKSDGDYDNDGDVDGDDFLGWQAEFGSGAGAAAAAVPEPTAITLVLAAGLLGLVVPNRPRRRRRKRRAVSVSSPKLQAPECRVI